jgi:hypothetical protein
MGGFPISVETAIIHGFGVIYRQNMNGTGRFPPSEAAGREPQRGVQEVRVRLTKPLLHQIELLVGLQYADRSDAIRGLLREALKGRSE